MIAISSTCLLSTVSKQAAATRAPRVAPARRCSATSVDCARLGAIAASVAIGIQSASGRCSPKGIATAIAIAIARITAYRMIGRVSFLGEMSPGISGNGAGRVARPCANHRTPASAIHTADPASQASAATTRGC